MDDLERLLQKHDLLFENVLKKEKEVQKEKANRDYKHNSSHLQRANGNATLLDFIDVVSLIIENSMDDLNVTVMPDEKAYVIKNDPIEAINHPIITFKIKSRVHKDKTGYKPKEVDSFTDLDTDKTAIVYSERFTSYVQFNIMAPEYRTAWEVMDRFEEVMLAYAEIIRGKGILEYYFNKQFTDEYYDTFRNTLTVLNLEYCVETEKLRVIFSENVKDEVVTGTTVNDKTNRL